MAPKGKSEKLKRLVAVQRHLERMAENDLANTARTRRELGESMDVIMTAIGSIDPIHRHMSRNYSERFSRLMTQEQQLSATQKVQESRVMRERAKADRLEDRMRDARTDEAREAEDNAIYDLIDQAIASAASPASSKFQKP
ncbi:hypothetical protein [Rhizobium sp. PAMB 3182]